MAKRRRLSEIEWLQVKLAYFAGKRPKELSALYGVGVATINTRIKKNNWSKEKESLRENLTHEFFSEFVNNLSEYQTMAKKQGLEYWNELAGKTWIMINEVLSADKKNKISEFERLIRVFEIIRKNIWACLDMDVRFNSDGSYTHNNGVPAQLDSEFENALKSMPDEEIVTYARKLLGAE